MLYCNGANTTIGTHEGYIFFPFLKEKKEIANLLLTGLMHAIEKKSMRV
jgi:hypothetical protein